MVNLCSVPSCKTTHTSRRKCTPNISIHEFPSNLPLREQWISRMATKGFTPGDWSYVCGLHFKPSDYIEGAMVRRLKKEAVPSLFPGNPLYDQVAATKAVKTRRRKPPPKTSSPPAKRISKCANQMRIEYEKVLQETLNITEEEIRPSKPLPLSTIVLVTTEQLQAIEFPCNDTNNQEVRDAVVEPPCDRETSDELQGVIETPAAEEEKSEELQLPGVGIKKTVTFARSYVTRNPQTRPHAMRRAKLFYQKKASYLEKVVKACKAKTEALEAKLRQVDNPLAASLTTIATDARNGSLKAIVLLDQIKAYESKQPTWSEQTVKSLLRQTTSPRGYKPARKNKMMALRSKNTLKRFADKSTATNDSVQQ